MNKNIFFLLPILFVLFSGCSKDDEPTEEVEYLAVPIVSTNLPEAFTAGETYKLRFTYSRPTRCHKLVQLDVEELKGEFFVKVVTEYDPAQECEIEDLTAATTVDFVAEPVDFYIFNLWQGRNAQGEDVYTTVQVPVNSNTT